MTNNVKGFIEMVNVQQGDAVHSAGEVKNVVNNYQRLSDLYSQIIVSQPFFINCYALYDKLLDKILKGKKFGTLLDVGCGGGVQTVVLAAHADKVTGIDISNEFVEVAKKRCSHLSNVRFQIENACQLPFQDNIFDGIVSYGDVLSHIIEGYELALSEMARVVKPGGWITFEVDNKWNIGMVYVPREIKEALKVKEKGHATREWQGMFFKTFTPSELKRLLKKFNLEVVEWHGHNIFASLVPDRYLLEEKRTFLGSAAIFLGKIDLFLSGVFPFNRFGFNHMLIVRKRN
ncbi:MAG: class I SAM-dependent methyltransferase [Nitrospirae bacterium]|nr:class I SAM-dependent methyltransferase [Nitrospirota bacterium]MBI3351920.1 class I SAM-dependent methyltransferase [Nitrospirota bacterium]